jgi:hypothetical protein
MRFQRPRDPPPRWAPRRRLHPRHRTIGAVGVADARGAGSAPPRAARRQRGSGTASRNR